MKSALIAVIVCDFTVACSQGTPTARSLPQQGQQQNAGTNDQVPTGSPSVVATGTPTPTPTPSSSPGPTQTIVQNNVGAVLLVADGFSTCPDKLTFTKEDMMLYAPVFVPALAAIQKKHGFAPSWIIGCKTLTSSAPGTFYYVDSNNPNSIAVQGAFVDVIKSKYVGLPAGSASTYVYSFSQGGGESIAQIPLLSSYGRVVMTSVDPIDSSTCNMTTLQLSLFSTSPSSPAGCKQAPPLPVGFDAIFAAGKSNKIINYYLNDSTFLLHSGALANALASPNIVNTNVTTEAKAASTTSSGSNTGIDSLVILLPDAQKQGILAHTAARILPVPIKAFLDAIAVP